MMNRTTVLRFLFPVVVGVLLILTYFIFWAPNTFDGERIIIVSKGMTFDQVADSLQAAGVIRSRLLFEFGGEILGKTKGIHIGKYLFRSGMSNKAILDDLSSGESALLLTVTIREGLKATKQAGVFTRELGIDSTRFVGLAFDPEFTRSFAIEASSLEGYLFPETYLFYWQTDEEEIIRQMVGSFQKFYGDSLKLRAEELGMTMNEILTLASIVEGEAVLDEERPFIAGVYYNRLKKHMRLEADPTIQYIVENGPRRLLYRDLHIDSPYNTYRHYGLPPGPVNNPGRASIRATLYPAEHQYLYFVANGEGGHTFSRTYREHRRAVHRYRRILTQRASF